MYNPREGKLRRNKYLNIGYEDSSTWWTRKLLADCIAAYLDEYEEDVPPTPEEAVSMLRDIKNGRDSKLLIMLEDLRGCNSALEAALGRLLQRDKNERVKAAEILWHINNGPFMLEVRENKGKERIK